MALKNACLRTCYALGALVAVAGTGCTPGDVTETEIASYTLAAGDEHCPSGGVRLEILEDGTVNESKTRYVCNGAQGEAGTPGENGGDGTSATIQTSAEPAGENCPGGGTRIDVLVDGKVQAGQTKYVCNGIQGEPGANGVSPVIQTSPEPAGANCANGGTRIDVLVGGVAQAGQTQYVCDGKNGQDATVDVNAVVQTSTEPAGANCPAGGTKIEFLVDGAVLEGQTQYVCNGVQGAPGTPGAGGTNATIRTSAELFGENCANGGTKIEVLLDGVVQPEQTRYVCNGVQGNPGTPGNDGASATVQTSAEPAGANCAAGGTRIDVLLDGVVQAGQTRYVCNGSQGNPGTPGADGSNATIRTSAEPAGANCANGGIKVEVLLDGQVQPSQTQYVCNGVNGADGQDGCDAGYHNDGAGNCVPSEACPPGYHDDGAGGCVQQGCALGYYKDIYGKCVSSGIEWITIPAGTFVSSATGESHEIDEFKLAKTPVTIRQFRACLEAEACSMENYDAYYTNCNRAGTLSTNVGCQRNFGRGIEWESHPMNSVNFYGAQQFCEWIGARLPMEYEWEYASTHDGQQARQTKYPWGNAEPVQCETANYYVYIPKAPGCDPSEYNCRTFDYYCDGKNLMESFVTVLQAGDTLTLGTSEVGTYSPEGDSPLGLVDMSGNVSEWTGSVWSAGHIFKGGHWSSIANYLNVSSFSSSTDDATWDYVGFRCAR